MTAAIRPQRYAAVDAERLRFQLWKDSQWLDIAGVRSYSGPDRTANEWAVGGPHTEGEDYERGKTVFGTMQLDLLWSPLVEGQAELEKIYFSADERRFRVIHRGGGRDAHKGDGTASPGRALSGAVTGNSKVFTVAKQAGGNSDEGTRRTKVLAGYDLAQRGGGIGVGVGLKRGKTYHLVVIEDVTAKLTAKVRAVPGKELADIAAGEFVVMKLPLTMEFQAVVQAMGISVPSGQAGSGSTTLRLNSRPDYGIDEESAQTIYDGQ